ncbi:polysaccharide deacetylase family protein [Mucilaginibacter rubeus]|uniref:Polysaccharide deacetylase family protein n=1 Tax=Mucilaginibacter rubeus TaxID=2027860 RepID=A0AAE6JAT4_9SPHI|nr:MULTISPECIES: polysaccharide deacetylase family protein [Mucilaginibacter]QEM02259.1 polysaccharide deacetylase family protein [Mucilaginibacter rubeus]QEM14885.1 polysaccharide deacetylase family protein [Mucilaginibacter gossypii]QTE42400.1 polysaccharide deacetylase family protein [Mucilaginibacter rubeus]QTE49003.1 polysaccharide deacetylase family protein [Mucilaginibacter rubeus]QTE54101.1 polysaccharide deacetylase family protein [Mucilaginibacter rubeus]
MSSRRDFVKQGGLLGLAGLVGSNLASAKQSTPLNNFNTSKWADGSKLVVSVSMQFEAGGQPDNAESPFPQNMQKGFIDLPGATWFQYGYKEGVPRMLDNWDKLGIKVTSHMVGSAVLKNPALAKEIVDRGHEAAAHGMNWATQYTMPYEQEKQFIKDGADAIKKVTGFTPVGYNANWLRRGGNTLKILQELGFVYHIDDLSRDEPFIIPVNQKDFVVVPYTIRNNDIVLIEGKNFSPDQFLTQVKMEFDQLYAEAEFKRRQMSISFHDRIGGTPQMVKAANDLIKYIQQHKGVSFKRKDEIAKMALEDKTTIRES